MASNSSALIEQNRVVEPTGFEADRSISRFPDKVRGGGTGSDREAFSAG